MWKYLSIMENNMKYENLLEYAREHTIKECAEHYECCLGCMKSYLYKHKIDFKRVDRKGKNNPNYKHGGNNTRLFFTWKSMLDRCRRPKNKQYKDYGGRGITVCSEWEDFTVFREWALNNGYTDSLTIDRIDNDKGYCPSNCRWANKYTQSNNKSNNRKITYRGETKTLAQWCKELNLNYGTVSSRLNRSRMSIDLALTSNNFNKDKKLYQELKQKLEE